MEKNKNNKKNRKLLLVSVLIASILLILFYLLLSRDKIQQLPKNITSDIIKTAPMEESWNTFVSDMWGFSIDYPPEWYVNEGQIVEFSNLQDASLPDAILVTVFRNSDVNTDNFNAVKAYYENNPSQFEMLGEGEINGIPMFEFDYKDRNQRQTVLVSPQLAKYSIFVLYPDKLEAEALTIYSRMVTSTKVL